MAAVLTADLDNTDRLVVLKDDCTRLGITLEPPDVNRSVFAFTVGGPKRICYGLGALKGVGQSAVEAIVERARRARADSRALLDLCRRVDLTKINRRVLEALVRSGALDSLGLESRDADGGDPGCAAARGALRARERGGTDRAVRRRRARRARSSTRSCRCASGRSASGSRRERESLGLYLTGHPFEDFAEHCKKIRARVDREGDRGLPHDGTPFHVRKDVILAGVVMDVRKRGNRVSIVLDDDTERIEVTLFEEVYAQCQAPDRRSTRC